MTAALLAAALFGAIAAVQASVIRRHGLLSTMMLGVLAGYMLGWLLHLLAIARLPLYLAQVGVGASLVVTALLAAFVMGEPLRREHWIAIVTMVAGLGVLAIAAGSIGQATFSERTTITLYVLLAVNAALGWLAVQWDHHYSGVALGILAGVAYGGSPVATRALVDFSWNLDTLAVAASIGLFGALGFVLYSIALKRTSVTAATAPLVLLQTVIPAAVGVALFHDGVRTGWWPFAVVAFVLSLGAGIVLCGAEARLEILPEAFGTGDELAATDQPS